MSYKIALKQKIVKKVVKKLLKNVQTGFNLKFTGTFIPIILVTGTVGKSSTTLMINELFMNAGFQVISGTSALKNLNSLEGFALTLIKYLIKIQSGENLNENELSQKINLEMESLGGILKLKKLLGFYKNLATFSNISPQQISKAKKMIEKTVIVMEIGFDTMSEFEVFNDIFAEIELLVTTSFTFEHSENFEDNFDTVGFDKIYNLLPPALGDSFKNHEIDGRLRNIALEQIKFLNISKNAIIPSSIGKIENNFYSNLGLDYFNMINGPVISRGEKYQLVDTDNNLNFGDKYLLPDTFAKNGRILLEICKQFNLENGPKKHFELVQKSVSNVNYPHSRFSKFSGLNKTTIIDSSYNSDPASLDGFLDTVSGVINHYKSPEICLENGIAMAPKHILIIGEMRELGDISTPQHSLLLEKIKELENNYPFMIEDVYLLGKEWLKCDQNEIFKSAGDIQYISLPWKNLKVFLKAGDILKFMKLEENVPRPHSWIWVKGSQNTIFSEIIVQSLLENPGDSEYLCRRGSDWDKKRAPWN